MIRILRDNCNLETAADLIAIGLFCAMLLNWSAILSAFRSMS